MRRLTLDYLKTESGSGLILAAAAALGLLLANSPEAPRYFAFLAAPITLQLGGFIETLGVGDWVRDGLMAVFFLVVGMEIKFEAQRGALSSPRRIGLPLAAALGGLVGPAAVYLALNVLPGGAPRGWPMGTPTDTAFAVAALAVAGPKLPPSLRLFLLTVAIVDDVVAVGLIGALYSGRVDLPMLAGALMGLAGLAVVSRWRRAPFLFYAVGFVVVWGFTLKSGISTSLAGVACACTVPAGARRAGQESVLKFFMDSLHPYVAFAILPLFAFTAAGFSLRSMTLAQAFAPAPAGVALALWLGKPLGVFGLALLAARLKLGRRPNGALWAEVLGVSMLCGVGFALSLYIGAAAFGPDAPTVRLGVAAGSVLAFASGAAVLAWAQRRRREMGEAGL